MKLLPDGKTVALLSNGDVRESRLGHPRDIAMKNAEEIFITDDYRIRKISLSF